MSLFEELDFESTPLGDISLRRREEPRLEGRVLYEVKLGDEFLMSSLFVEAEVALSTLALQRLGRKNSSIVVGGLGLGHTAAAVLDDTTVSSLKVIEVMAPVIRWHQNALVPLGKRLSEDPRCDFVLADFFALAMSDIGGFDIDHPDQKADALLLDIDHSPSHWLNPGNAGFYSKQGLLKMAAKIQPGGVFGLWSNDPPDSAFVALLDEVFVDTEAHVIAFANPYSGGESTNTVYLSGVGDRPRF